ncbi:TetR family transcriptional regulator [Hypericibacter terrae]|jgi:TetR/AcrR family transcriptional regulator|uniref:TetR family transcriptional regulator n=1 Tax=Hypericibacter terrae TaxID=2602015 RepID=A0A5J6MYC4_9PROT|nr:TetR family transcriptional regulator C-terminal domain-containing protein [Hypericibacter terrae]QEX19656.1 TetR family transcriptional regulator [Hypericibacter terrae]
MELTEATAHDAQPSRRPGAKRVVNEARILAAAEEIFAEAGYAAASMAAIAERAGLPKANLHYYFGTKEQLYLRLLDTIVDGWQETMDLFTADSDPTEAFRLYIADKIEFSRRRPRASKIFANEILHGAPHFLSVLQTRIRERFHRHCAVIEGWIREGKIAPVDPHHLFFVLWASTQHYADFDIQVPALLGKESIGPEDYRAATELITRMVLATLGLETSAPR